MDLFTSTNLATNKAAVSDHLSESWVRQLDADTIARLRDLMDKVYMEYLDDTCYPAWPDIFKAFNLLLYEEVRVVILGQDPYFDGNATGLAFACKQHMSPSLQKIVGAIYRNFPEEYTERRTLHPSSGMNLIYLVQQGVLLMNTALTVHHGNPGSHTAFWEPFTKAMIAALRRRPKLVWLLWGKHAKSYQEYINPDHIVMTADHPAAAARENRDWNCDHFKEVNKIISPPIIWI